MIEKGKNNMEVMKKLMLFQEARECVDKINSNMTNIRSLILDLYEREGWSALGYQSWRECVTAEFKQGENYLYKQLEAARAERNIICTNVQNQIPEGQLRPLTKLNNDPELQKEAWQKAVETAPKGKITAAHVYKIVKGMTMKETNTEEIIVVNKEDSRNLADLKTSWHTCNAADKRKFVKWVKEYFGRYI